MDFDTIRTKIHEYRTMEILEIPKLVDESILDAFESLSEHMKELTKAHADVDIFDNDTIKYILEKLTGNQNIMRSRKSSAFNKPLLTITEICAEQKKKIIQTEIVKYMTNRQKQHRNKNSITDSTTKSDLQQARRTGNRVSKQLGLSVVYEDVDKTNGQKEQAPVVGILKIIIFNISLFVIVYMNFS
eukprot:GHVL01019403.1.p2 GENE.GHVL01019403.1~~GHVL01019403.1.p2  ORF type:complete len:187 (+),score=33.34 GHVL01019403.1:100-660(+)